jgi:hypothetical protein
MTAKLDPSYIDKVAAFDGGTKSRPEVAALVGISKSALANIIKVHGFNIGKPRAAPKPRPAPKTTRKVAPRQPGYVTVTKFAASGYSQPRPIHVSLPPPPCGIVFSSDRTETDPTARTIRDPNATWQRDRILASAGRVTG